MVGSPFLKLQLDLVKGTYSIQWGAAAHVVAACSAVKLSDGRMLRTSDCPRHTCAATDVQPFHDRTGAGALCTVHHSIATGGELRQRFWVYVSAPYVVAQVELVSPGGAATNWMSPLVADGGPRSGVGLTPNRGDAAIALVVPFDNDEFVRYRASHLDHMETSCEITALYKPGSRHGLVLGSVTHDMWKTGIALSRPGGKNEYSVTAYGGEADALTHDSEAHGVVHGSVIRSPRILVGYFNDYRYGLELYAKANAQLCPGLRWGGGAPIGWNSWAARKEAVSYTDFVAASGLLRSISSNHNNGFKRGLYVNLDSYWDNLTEQQLRAAAALAHAAGQKAGIYWTPFTMWGNDIGRSVEGTASRYKYSDILLRGHNGEPLAKHDGARPLDPSHPGTLQRIDWQLQRFATWGFDYVKLDFVSHGALEGAHFLPGVETGIEAYNIGMQRIDSALKKYAAGRQIFLSLAISPIFPAGYGHSRRISCDAFGTISQTEYMLNSLSGGWWAGGSLYRYNDPDQTVLYAERGHNPTSTAEAQSRFTASVLAGTVLLDSDDLSDLNARSRVVSMFSQPLMNALARSGHTFMPVEGLNGDRSADMFEYRDARSDRAVVGVFNFSANSAVTRTINLQRLGLSSSARYHVRDLWSGSQTTASGTVIVPLAAAACAVLSLSR